MNPPDVAPCGGGRASKNGLGRALPTHGARRGVGLSFSTRPAARVAVPGRCPVPPLTYVPRPAWRPLVAVLYPPLTYVPRPSSRRRPTRPLIVSPPSPGARPCWSIAGSIGKCIPDVMSWVAPSGRVHPFFCLTSQLYAVCATLDGSRDQTAGTYVRERAEGDIEKGG